LGNGHQVKRIGRIERIAKVGFLLIIQKAQHESQIRGDSTILRKSFQGIDRD